MDTNLRNYNRSIFEKFLLSFPSYISLISRDKGTNIYICTIATCCMNIECSAVLTPNRWKRLQSGTHFKLRPETGGPLPGIVVVRRTGTAAGMALCVQPQRTTFVFFHCKSSTQ